MSRPIGRQTQILNVRLPPELHAEFVAEAGSDYGARSDLFRRMLRHWLNGADNRVLEQRYRTERARRIALEAQLERVRQALSS